MGSAGVVVDGLVRLVRSFMEMCMGFLVVGVVCSVILARYIVFSKQVLMFGCFVDEKSCSGVGPGGRISRVLANSPSHRLAKLWIGDLAWRV
jgi:hypothetical protein